MKRHLVGLVAVALAVALPASASASGMVVTPETLPHAKQGIGYRVDMGWQADGVTVTEPVTFAATKGKPPSGITLYSNGVLYGSTQAIGPYTFTVTASDAAGHSGSRQYTLNVDPNLSKVDDLLSSADYLLGGLIYCLPSYLVQIVDGTFPRPCG